MVSTERASIAAGSVDGEDFGAAFRLGADEDMPLNANGRLFAGRIRKYLSRRKA
jgi:hypothetical protein